MPCAHGCAFTLEHVETTVSHSDARAERLAAGQGVDAVVWEEVELSGSDRSSGR